MSHGLDNGLGRARPDPDMPKSLRAVEGVMLRVNDAMVVLGMLALLTASAVLTYSVFSRYLLKASTDWQDEAAVFCLVGATFLCGSFVQSLRGHVGIDAVATLLPAGLNRLRLLAVEILCTAFCSFFAWKSWTLFHEAWVEKQTTSSSWAPPLWIPYALMALGMSLLAIQLALQLVARANGIARARRRIDPATPVTPVQSAKAAP
jgi:TRAP-type C4-dicarboxylate transport system permease small subunit